jgi:hypothetical protein
MNDVIFFYTENRITGISIQIIIENKTTFR